MSVNRPLAGPMMTFDLSEQIAELRRQTAKVNSELEERRNAAAGVETTIRKRLPELDQLVP